jgi:hypothetical protein
MIRRNLLRPDVTARSIARPAPVSRQHGLVGTLGAARTNQGPAKSPSDCWRTKQRQCRSSWIVGSAHLRASRPAPRKCRTAPRYRATRDGAKDSPPYPDRNAIRILQAKLAGLDLRENVGRVYDLCWPKQQRSASAPLPELEAARWVRRNASANCKRRSCSAPHCCSARRPRARNWCRSSLWSSRLPSSDDRGRLTRGRGFLASQDMANSQVRGRGQMADQA